MLKKLSKAYLFITLILFMATLPFVENNYLIFYVNIFCFFIYYFILHSEVRNRHTIELKTIVFYSSLLSVSIYNLVSYIYEGHFLMPNPADANNYDYYSKRLAQMNISEGIKYLSSLGWGIDDWGAPLFISTFYRIIPSNLFINFIYIILGIFSAQGLFSISRRFMSPNYARVCAITFSISSYMIYYYSSGLKEAIMVFLVIKMFEHYYKYQISKKNSSLIFMIISTALLIFFRPPIMFFFIGAIGIASLLQVKQRVSSAFLIIIVIAAVLISSSLLESNYNRFLRGGEIGNVDEAMVYQGNKVFTYFVNTLAQLIGPLPTVSPDINSGTLSFYSSGLIFRVLISFPFWVGVYFIIKRKIIVLYPLIFFIIMEMVSLILIIEGLELRKSLVHLPFVYVIAFWYMNKYDNKESLFSNRVVKNMLGIVPLTAFLIILFWNLR